jgi:hypothetical protein
LKLIEYPREFSRDARNQVESAKIHARRELEQVRKTVESGYNGYADSKFTQAFFDAILKVFLAFAKEAIKISSWGLDRADRESQHFLVQLTIQWHYEEGYDRKGCRVRDVAGHHNGVLLESVNRWYKQRPEWRQYEDLLLSVTQDIESAPKSALATEETSPRSQDLNAKPNAERAAKRQAVITPILEQKGWKPGRLVTESGLGKNSVYEYLDGTRSKITRENRKAMADALGMSEEQLPD